MLAVRLSYRSLLVVIGIIALGLATRNVVDRSLGIAVWALRCTVVAAAVHPLVARLGRRIPRVLAVLVTLAGITAVVGGVTYTVVGDVRSEQSRLSRVLPEAAQRIETSTRFGRAATDFQLSARVDDLLAALPRQLAGGRGTAAVRRNATRGATVLVNIVLSIFLVLYGGRMVNGALGQIQDESRRRQVTGLVHRAYERAWTYLVGRLGLGIVAGLFAYVLCRLASVPGHTVLALVVLLGSAVPYIGVVVGGLPIVLLAFGLHPSGSTGSLVLLALLAYQTLDVVVFMRPLHRRSIVIGPAITLLTAMMFFALGGLGLALSGIAVVVFAACVVDEVAPKVAVTAATTDVTAAPVGAHWVDVAPVEDAAAADVGA